MNYVDLLLEGEEEKRDILLVLTFWALVLPIGLYLALQRNTADGPQAIDVLQNANIASVSGLLTRRLPIPNAEYSILLSPKSSVLPNPQAKALVAKVPVGADGALLAAGLLVSPKGFKAVQPKHTEGRKMAFLSKWARDLEMLRGDYHAGKLISYRPIIAKGLPGFEAHFREKDVEKLQIELFSDKRCFRFEVSRVGAPLSAEDRAFYYAVIASMEDFSELKKKLLTQ